MTLALDSDVFIELINGRNAVLRRRYDLALLSGRPIAISAVVIQELALGALISARPDHQMSLVRSFAAEHEVVDWTHADAEATARVRAELERTGNRIGSYDGLLAGQALNRGWTVVTGNQRDFGRVRDLELEDWSPD